MSNKFPKFFLFLLLLSEFNLLFSSTFCTMSKLEVDIEKEKPSIRETKTCHVHKKIENEANSPEISDNCKMIHEVSTTEVQIAYEIDDKQEVVVQLNNMNPEKPLYWQSRVKINDEPKKVISVAAEQINVQCHDSL